MNDPTPPALTTNEPEPRRIATFRKQLIARIPRFPNTRETLRLLEAEPLTTLLVHYTSWVVRFIPNVVREVEISTDARQDHRWQKLRPGIDRLLEKVKRGEDINAHLSDQPYKRGYTPKQLNSEQHRDNWADKDQVLNVMGCHHLHLGVGLQPNGLVDRTNDLLFVEVTREKFVVVAICDHSVFQKTDVETGAISRERARLWDITMRRRSHGLPPGTAFMPYMISSSGHVTSLVMSSMHFARVIADIEPHLDDPQFVREFYQKAGMNQPGGTSLAWHMNFADLCLADGVSDHVFTLAYAKF